MNKIIFNPSTWIRNVWPKEGVKTPAIILLCLVGLAIALPRIYASLRGRVKHKEGSSTAPKIPSVINVKKEPKKFSREPLDEFKERILQKTLVDYNKNSRNYDKYPIDYTKYPLARITYLGVYYHSISLDQVRPFDIKLYSEGASYFGYQYEGVNDQGWGCGWRNTQTILSYYGIHCSLKELFHTFGDPENLKETCKRAFPEKTFSNLEIFAAFNNKTRWIEPFTTQVIGKFFGIDSDLEVLYGITSAYTPPEAFPKEFMDFSTFKNKLLIHFASNRAPVMLDNGSYTYCIIGVACEDESDNTILWIADPHVKLGESGLYTIILEEKKSEERSGPCASSQLNFSEERRWMVLFPTTKR